MTAREKIINIARAEVGNKENPKDSNLQKYGEWFGLNGYAWCAMFVSWIFNHADCSLPKIDRDKGYCGCQTGYNFWKKAGMITDKPQMADIVLFDWNKDNHFDHTGIFLHDNGNGTFSTIEGNTSVGNDSNGGEVMIRIRNYSIAKFVDVTKYLK